MTKKFKKLKRITAIALAVAVMATGCTAGTSSSETQQPEAAGAYKAGTYTAVAKGNNGDVTIDVTLTADKIENIKIVKHTETPGLGDNALVKVSEEIISTQSLAVDMVTGATYSSKAMVDAVADAVTQAGGDAEALKIAKEADETKTEVVELTTDVVVVGAGGAGMSAAIEAADKGAKVILLEKGSKAGGSTSFTEGAFAINSVIQQEQGIEVPIEEVLIEEMEYSHYEADANIWKKFLENSGETIKWLRDMGVKFRGAQTMGEGLATWHIYEGFGESVINDTMVPKSKSLGVEIMYETPGKSLIMDGDRVAGVMAEGADNKTYKINAKSVILATGGYLNNQEMMEELTNYDLDRMVAVSSGLSTGDGLKMAWEVGAQQYRTGMAMLFGGYLKGEGMRSPMNVGSSQQPLLWINQNGERFVNEAVIYNFSEAGNAIYTQEKVFTVMDTNTVKYLEEEGCFMGLGVYLERGTKLEGMQAEIDAAVEAGKEYVIKADSIEELAEKMGANKETLVENIEKYNSFCASGNDQDFYKDAKYLLPVNEGPFYAFELSSGAFCTMGGLKVNTNNEVLKLGGESIPGLYAAGNDASGLVGDTYGPNMPGTCVGYAMYSGRNSAINAVEYISTLK